MGGNALSIKSIRLSKDLYFKVSQDILAKLITAYPNSLIKVIPAYTNKESFGDIDILISSDYDPNIKAFEAFEIVKNGPLTSYGIMVDSQPVQVDLISVDRNNFDYKLNYLAFNDLNNLLGHIGKGIHLNYCEDGLYYYVLNGKSKFRKILITNDFSKTLSILGLDFEIFFKGFDNLEDIFQYAISSKYFNKDLFLLKKLKNSERKRENYMKFLKYLETHDTPTYNFTDDESIWFQRICDYCPNFLEQYSQAQSDLKNIMLCNMKFNKKIVSIVTDLKGKELDLFMRKIKTSFSEDYVLSATDEDIKNKILYIKNNSINI